MQPVEVGLFYYLVSDSVATIGTVNTTWVMKSGDSVYQRNAYIDKINTHYDVNIPKEITYNNQIYKVTVLGHMAFANSDITGVFIPQYVHSILNYAFDWCYKLASIEFDTFSELKNIYFSLGVGSIIKSFKIPSSVTFIDQYFFTSCSTILKITYDGLEEPVCNTNHTNSDFYVLVKPEYSSSKFCSKTVYKACSRPIASCKIRSQVFSVVILFVCPLITIIKDQ